MDDKNLYTPQELVDEFPVLDEFGWNATKLGMLFNMGILKGRRINKKALITLKSLKQFVDYYNLINDEKMNF